MHKPTWKWTFQLDLLDWKREDLEKKNKILNLEALWQQTQAEQAVSWCLSLVQNLDNPKNYSLKTGTTMQT